MWLLTIHAIPNETSPKVKKIGGAYINCWINFALEDGAELLARFYIEQNNWIVLEIDDISRVELDDYSIDDEKREYFIEAEQDGTCFLYNEYPLTDEPEEYLDAEDSTGINQKINQTGH